MSDDQFGYKPCPGGKDKKIKFCCRELVHDLEQVDRMLRGEQFTACLELLERLDQKQPGRACVLTLKAALERRAGLAAQAEETLRPLVAAEPNNPVTLTERAKLHLEQQGDLATAIDLLQSALENGAFPPASSVSMALGLLARRMIVENKMLAGRALLYAFIALTQNEEGMRLLVGLDESPISAISKTDFFYRECHAEAAWKAEFNAAMELAQTCRWRRAAAALEKLEQAHPNEPSIVGNLAICRTMLVQDEAAAATWRRLAEIAADETEAVEALILARAVGGVHPDDRLAQVEVEAPLRDIDRAMTALASTKHAQANDPRTAVAEEGDPPPRFAYTIVDPPIAPADASVTADTASRVLGEVLLYGRETDRDARALIHSTQGKDLDRLREILAERCGDAIGEPTSTAPLATIPKWEATLGFRLVVSEMSLADRTNLIADLTRRNILEALPKLRLAELEGKTLEEAAGDARLRRRALSLLLSIELENESVVGAKALAELRERLKLPAPPTLTPEQAAEPEGQSPLRVHRVDPATLSDESLLHVYDSAARRRIRGPAYQLACEIARRTSLHGKVPLAQVCMLASQWADSSDDSLSWIDRARDAAVASRKSSAPYDLAELHTRLARGEPQEVSRLLQHLISEHGQEKGVPEAVARVMYQLGLITPDGRFKEDAAPIAASPQSEPEKIWTPDGEKAAEGKSKLWLPD